MKTGRFYAVKVIDKRILISQNQTHSIFREKEVLALHRCLSLHVSG